MPKDPKPQTINYNWQRAAKKSSLGLDASEPITSARGAFKLQTSLGFTLIETMLALAVLAIGFLGVYVAVRTSLNAAIATQNNLVASNLVQEGMELVRNLRDLNWKQNQSFGYFLTQAQGTSPFIMDWTMYNLAAGSANPVLKLDNSGRYNYSNGTDTVFKRLVYVSWQGVSGEQINVRTVVSWTERGNDKQIEAEENLLNWR